jgi:hypothetical protein
VEFLVISLFHKTKIPTVDMMVQVSSNFKKQMWKKMKSPNSMRNGRFNTSKFRGKLQKMGCWTPQEAHALLHVSALKKTFKKSGSKKIRIKWGAATCTNKLSPMASRRPAVAGRATTPN